MSILKHLDINGITYDIGEEQSVNVYYGTCDTTASSAAKIVTCSDFTLTEKSIIGITFSTANTSSSLSLNINSTGAKNVYKGTSTPNSTTNFLKWSANTILYFLYDGTYYRYITSMAADGTVRPEGAGCWHGTCTTSSSTSSKASTIANYSLVPGTIVNIGFSNGNTVVGALTLNINSTGAKTIYYNSYPTSNTNSLLWDANEVVTFVYDGSYYHFVARSGDYGRIKTINSSINNINANIGDMTGLIAPDSTNLVNAINSVNVFSSGLEIMPEEDLNDFIYTFQGTYYCTQSPQTILNAPAGIRFSLNGNSIYDYTAPFKMMVSEITPIDSLDRVIVKQEIFIFTSQVQYTNGVYFRYLTVDRAQETIVNAGNWQQYLVINPDNGFLLPKCSLDSFRITRDVDKNITPNFILVGNDAVRGSTYASMHSLGGLVLQDKNSQTVAGYTGRVLADSSSSAYLYAQNTDGHVNRLEMTIDDSDNRVVKVSDAGAWRSAIDILKPERVTIKNSGTVSVPSTTSPATSLANYTFSAGVWLVDYRVSFPNSSVGRRACFLSTSSTGGAVNNHVNANQSATNGAATVMGLTTTLDIASSTKYYFNVMQNSGSSQNVSPFIYAIKLSD